MSESDVDDPRGNDSHGNARGGDVRDRRADAPRTATAGGQSAGAKAQALAQSPKPNTVRHGTEERAPQARAGPNRIEGPLECAIEAERSRLLQALAVLKCLYEVLLYRDDEDSVVHAETAEVAANLISESIDNLDRVRLRPLIDAAKRTSPSGARDSGVPHNKVEDAPPRYLC